MVPNNIKALVQKYDSGETSLDEERSLSHFFTTQNVPEEYSFYEAIFKCYKDQKNESYKAKTPPLVKNISFTQRIYAASMILFVSVSFVLFMKTNPSTELTDQKISEAKEALHIMADPIKMGKKEWATLTSIKETIFKNTNLIGQLGYFNKTSQILKEIN